jgi:hypothetical protein
MRSLLTTVAAALTVGLVLAAGCDKPQAAAPGGPAAAASAAGQAVTPAGFVLDKAPDGVKDVAAVKAAGVKDGDTVIVRGVVGGSEKPFVGTRAVVQIIDPGVQTCDKMPGENCKTPWDACCNQDDAKAKGATVQVVDAAGNPLKGTLEGVGGLKPLAEVVVRGKARMEGGKVLVVDADAIYVKR